MGRGVERERGERRYRLGSFSMMVLRIEWDEIWDGPDADL